MLMYTARLTSMWNMGDNFWKMVSRAPMPPMVIGTTAASAESRNDNKYGANLPVKSCPKSTIMIHITCNDCTKTALACPLKKCSPNSLKNFFTTK